MTPVSELPARTNDLVVPASPAAPAAPAERKGLSKKELAADQPTWCPGCGDFSVLALYFKLIEKRKMWHEKITTVAGIGQIAATREAFDAAGKALASTRVGRELGTQSMTDLLLAIQNLASAQGTYSLVRHQFVLNRLLLQQSAGSASERDLAAINALLQ